MLAPHTSSIGYSAGVILWSSPLPPIRSGVSDYAVELLEPLARRVPVRVVRPPGWEPDQSWPLGDEVELVDSDESPRANEIEVLHLGNNPHHLWLLPRLARGGSVVVLHDLVLHHLLVEATAAAGRQEVLEEALEQSHGVPGRAVGNARRVGVRGRRDPFLLPAFAGFLGTAAGCVVHSSWAADQVRRALPVLPVQRIGLAVADPGPIDRAVVRRELGLEDDTLALMHVGFLTPEKGLAEILAGLAAARKTGVRAELVLIGEGTCDRDLTAAVVRVDVGDSVRSTGWLDGGAFRRAPAAADLGVVLRTPSAGETSAAAVRFLAAATPVAVTAHRQLLEWPAAAAPRVTPRPAAAADLARWLQRAATDPDWPQRRQAARAAYLAQHRPEQAAVELIAFVSSLHDRS